MIDKMVHVTPTILAPPSSDIGHPAIIDPGDVGRTRGLRVVVFTRDQANLIFNGTVSARLDSVVCVDIPRAALCINLVQALDFYDRSDN